MKFTNMNEIRSATTEELEARLAELKGIKVAEPKELSKDDIDELTFKARADELMNVDPEEAMKWLQKAEDVKLKRETSTAALSPDAARQQLRISRDNAIRTVQSTSPDVDKTTRDIAQKEAMIYSAEMAKTNPSVQFANQQVNELYSGKFGDGGIDKPDEYKTIEKDISDSLEKIKTTGTQLDDENIRLNNLISNSGLSLNDKSALVADLKRRTDSKPKPGASAQSKADKYAETYLGYLDVKDFSKKIRDAKQALNALKSEYNTGNYATANLKVFKDVMGAMSAGEYGIATDSKASAVVSSLPVFGESIANAISVGKFNNKEDAKKRINEAVKSFNSLVNQYGTPDNLISSSILKDTEFNKDQFVKAVNKSPAFGALKTALGGKVDEIDGLSTFKLDGDKQETPLERLRRLGGKK